MQCQHPSATVQRTLNGTRQFSGNPVRPVPSSLNQHTQSKDYWDLQVLPQGLCRVVLAKQNPSGRAQSRKWGCRATTTCSASVSLSVLQFPHPPKGARTERTAHGEGKTLPQRLLWIWGAFTRCLHVPYWVKGSCSSRTGSGSGLSQTLYRGQSLPKRVSGAPGCGSSVTCQERTQMPLPRPQTPAGHSTLQDLLWGHLIWGGNFLLLVLCLKIKCLSSLEQLGHGALTPGSHQGAAGTSLQALGWR